MYWKSDPMFVCRLEDKDLPALGGPAEKVRGRGGGAARAVAQLGWSGGPGRGARAESWGHRGRRQGPGRTHRCRWASPGRHGAPGRGRELTVVYPRSRRPAPQLLTRTPALPPLPCRPPHRRGPWPQARVAPPGSACAAAAAWRLWTSTCSR